MNEDCDIDNLLNGGMVASNCDMSYMDPWTQFYEQDDDGHVTFADRYIRLEPEEIGAGLIVEALGQLITFDNERWVRRGTTSVSVTKNIKDEFHSANEEIKSYLKGFKIVE